MNILAKTTAPALMWWLAFCLQLTGVAYAVNEGLFQRLWNADATGLCIFVMLPLYLITTSMIGYRTIRDDDSSTERLWFISDAQLSVGMIGTMIGFVMMLQSTFVGFDISNAQAAQKIIAGMGLGLSTANWATIVGLFCSLMTKAQVVNLERLRD